MRLILDVTGMGVLVKMRFGGMDPFLISLKLFSLMKTESLVNGWLI
jgi:hypothetical protein